MMSISEADVSVKSISFRFQTGISSFYWNSVRRVESQCVYRMDELHCWYFLHLKLNVKNTQSSAAENAV